jgi:tungstate transport system substrate-binding protein
LLSRLLLMAVVSGSGALHAAAAEESIIVASTTSTQDSGFFSYLLPIVQARTGIAVRVIAQGTGQALDTARRGDADVVFVHDPDAERRFVAEGHGVARHPVMYNDFVIVGPAADPARIRGGRDAVQALRAIASAGQPFVSRGDRSGTHQAELRLWSAAAIDVDGERGRWYRSVGQGMGAALNIASASDAYVLTDRASWIGFGNKGTLQVLLEGDQRLFNPYGLILVSPARHPHVKAQAGQRFIAFLLSPEGQQAIAAFRVDGQQLFIPDARADGAGEESAHR